MIAENTVHRSEKADFTEMLGKAGEISVSVNGLAWGDFRDCKTVYPGSIPGVAST
jgi:hypothetical protein